MGLLFDLDEPDFEFEFGKIAGGPSKRKPVKKGRYVQGRGPMAKRLQLSDAGRQKDQGKGASDGDRSEEIKNEGRRAKEVAGKEKNEAGANDRKVVYRQTASGRRLSARKRSKSGGENGSETRGPKRTHTKVQVGSPIGELRESNSVTVGAVGGYPPNSTERAKRAKRV
ncbi:hypothetical protein FRC11_003412 [Ceratobasidium sp. 423]|nr:hypothetical protein FRC11_003412 [Ceratobasidium sp. 423]